MLLSDIRQIEYELPSNIMRVHLKKPQNIDGLNVDVVEYRVSIDVFYEKLDKYNKYKLATN